MRETADRKAPQANAPRRSPRRSFGTPLLLLPLLAACAATWTPRLERAPALLQWPPAPAAARVVFRESLIGFSRGRDAGAVARAIAFGGEVAEDDRFGVPVAAAAGRDGRLAVADLGRRCVHLYLPGESRYLRLVGAREAPLVSPVGVAFDDDSRLYVTDSTGRVLVFGADGGLVATWSRAGGVALQRPTGVAWSRQQRVLYVVDTAAHTIYAFTPRGELARSLGGRGEGAGSFNFPTHVACAPSGEIFVTDALNFRVQILGEDGAWHGGFGHHGDGSGDLAMPKGIAVDGRGIVYLADSLFDNLQLFDREGRFLLTLGGRGVEPGAFWLPVGLSISEHGDLYVADSYNRRVQVFHLSEHDVDAKP